jgi:hypothetical protein
MVTTVGKTGGTIAGIAGETVATTAGSFVDRTP